MNMKDDNNKRYIKPIFDVMLFIQRHTIFWSSWTDHEVSVFLREGTHMTISIYTEQVLNEDFWKTF